MLAGAAVDWLPSTRSMLTSPANCAPQKDPKKRPTALALQQHKFVSTAKKPVRCMHSKLPRTQTAGVWGSRAFARSGLSRQDTAGGSSAAGGARQDLARARACPPWCCSGERHQVAVRVRALMHASGSRGLTFARSCRYVRGVSNWNFNIEDLKVCFHHLGGQSALHSSRTASCA